MPGGGVGVVLEGAAVRPAESQQPALFAVPASSPARQRGQRGPNRNTKATRDWILSRFDNPLEGMVALSLPSDMIQIAEKARAMAAVFRCTAKEALELMLKASAAANPYLNSAMPQDLNINSKSVALVIGMDAQGAGGGLAQLRDEMLARARTASPEGAVLLEGVAAELSEEKQDNSTV